LHILLEIIYICATLSYSILKAVSDDDLFVVISAITWLISSVLITYYINVQKEFIMNRKTAFVLALLMIFIQVASTFAATSFMMTASVPLATTVDIVASKIPLSSTVAIAAPTFMAAAAPTAIYPTTANLDFGTLAFDSPNGIWLPASYFAIDVSNNGPGAPTVTITYADDLTPAYQAHGLGHKVTADFMKLVWTSASTPANEFPIPGHPKTALYNMGTKVIDKTLLAGGWLRVYVGISDGKSGNPAEPFTNADQPGDYTGKLTITAVAG